MSSALMQTGIMCKGLRTRTNPLPLTLSHHIVRIYSAYVLVRYVRSAICYTYRACTHLHTQ